MPEYCIASTASQKPVQSKPCPRPALPRLALLVNLWHVSVGKTKEADEADKVQINNENYKCRQQFVTICKWEQSEELPKLYELSRHI